jgi:ABC-2 type transport system permease protein
LNDFLLAAATLWQREMTRFWREKSRVVGYVGSPLVFWAVIGSGFGDLGFFFPGALTLTIMFSAVFSTMSLIEDRREGFLLSMLVSPAPRSAMVLGKVVGSATLAWLQGLIFLAFVAFTPFTPGLAGLAAVSVLLFGVAFMFTAFGFLLAWKIDSTQGFHAVMNLLLLPLWMLSGSLFSVTTAHGWVRAIMQANPLTYAVAALRQLLGAPVPAAPLATNLTVTGVFAVGLWLAATWVASRKPSRSSA